VEVNLETQVAEMADLVAVRVGQVQPVQPHQRVKEIMAVRLTKILFLVWAAVAEKVALEQMEMELRDRAVRVALVQMFIRLGTPRQVREWVDTLRAVAVVHQIIHRDKVRLDQAAQVLLHTTRLRLTQQRIQVRGLVA
jgi:hypothetical protein